LQELDFHTRSYRVRMAVEAEDHGFELHCRVPNMVQRMLR
jgi:hypothetical protein